MNNTAGNRPEVVDWFVRARRRQKQQLRQLSQLGSLAGEISSLVHMLQCERGAVEYLAVLGRQTVLGGVPGGSGAGR